MYLFLASGSASLENIKETSGKGEILKNNKLIHMVANRNLINTYNLSLLIYSLGKCMKGNFKSLCVGTGLCSGHNAGWLPVRCILNAIFRA